MARAEHTFENTLDVPIYVSVEPWPRCYELEPGDKLTLIWDAEEHGPAADIDATNERDIVIWPFGYTEGPLILFNGRSADSRNWRFKHYPPS
jgi:hypothetical protein